MSTLYLDPPCSSRRLRNLQDLYWWMHTRAFVGKIYSFITGHSRSLLDLTSEVSRRKIRSQHYAGSRTVPIYRIKGSEGRSDDFDCDFNPMHPRTRYRWMSIALALACGNTLPMVELIQLGEDYFVRDGHHRISVARALGQDYIDANVVLELEPVSTPLPTCIKVTPYKARQTFLQRLEAHLGLSPMQLGRSTSTKRGRR